MMDYSLAKLTFWLTAAGLVQSSTITIVTFKGSSVTIPCEIEFYNYPRWGDQNDIIYNYQGQSNFNKVALSPEKLSRLEWATNERDLKLKNVTLHDSGVYHCVVDTSKHYAELEVRALPSAPALLNITYVDNMTVIEYLQDVSVTIICVSRGGYPEPYLDIYMGTEQIQASKRVAIETDNSVTVTITSTFIATRDNDGVNITCQSSYDQPDTRKTTSAILYLSYEPITVITDGPERTVTEGQSKVILTCYANSKPPSTIIWLIDKDNDPVMSVNGTTDDNSALYTITSVKRTHSGEYTCMADNGIGSPHRSSIRLTVHYPPDVTVITKNTTMNDTSVDIKCEAIGVPSKYVFYPWRQTWPGTNIVIRDTINSAGNILTILQPSYQDTGVYTCSVENGVSLWDKDTKIITGSAYLLIESSPIVTMPSREDGDVSPPKISAELNTEFTYNISFYSNSGDVQLQFYRLLNNTKVNVPVWQKISTTDVQLQLYQTEVQTKGRKLTIAHTLREEDQYGLIYVDIINRFGTASVPLEIIPEEKVPGSGGTDNVEAIGTGTAVGVTCLLAVVVIAGIFVWHRRHTSFSQPATNDNGTAHGFPDSKHRAVKDIRDTQQENEYQNLRLNTLDTPAGLDNGKQARTSISDDTVAVYQELNQRILDENTYSTLSVSIASNATRNMVIEMATYQTTAESTGATPTSDYQELRPDSKDNAK